MKNLSKKNNLLILISSLAILLTSFTKNVNALSIVPSRERILIDVSFIVIKIISFTVFVVLSLYLLATYLRDKKNKNHKTSKGNVNKKIIKIVIVSIIIFISSILISRLMGL